ncbi:MAG TPA: hypothetical protein VJV23_00340 [Candidatus Polarisedimenticolia bacterium]|nr:hypothetical protein [Candidatus Polarisedimenticolia bacterium]
MATKDPRKAKRGGSEESWYHLPASGKPPYTVPDDPTEYINTTLAQDNVRSVELFLDGSALKAVVWKVRT